MLLLAYVMSSYGRVKGSWMDCYIFLLVNELELFKIMLLWFIIELFCCYDFCFKDMNCVSIIEIELLRCNNRGASATSVQKTIKTASGDHKRAMSEFTMKQLGGFFTFYFWMFLLTLRSNLWNLSCLNLRSNLWSNLWSSLCFLWRS